MKDFKWLIYCTLDRVGLEKSKLEALSQKHVPLLQIDAGIQPGCMQSLGPTHTPVLLPS